MLPFEHISDVVGEVVGNIVGRGSSAVGEAPEIGEREIRRTVVDGKLRCSSDPQLRSNVGGVGKIRSCNVDVPAERQRGAVIEAPAEAVAPSGGRADPIAGS